MRRSAVLSPCGRYRHLLVREWGDLGKTAVFVLLNPSTADATTDDPTSRRCIAFARAWGCSALHIVNLYSRRATHPRDLWTAQDPVGPENYDYLCAAAAVAREAGGPLVAGWGNHAKPDRVADVLALPGMQGIRVLAVTRPGNPHHPLRLAGSLTPVAWKPHIATATGRSVPSPCQLSVVVSRPHLPDVRIGQYDFEASHEAATFANSLRFQRSSNEHVPGTTITVQPYRGAVDHLSPRLPTDPYQLAELMADEPHGDGTGSNFPGLWPRLQAQEGRERAAQIWDAASTAYDVLHHQPA
ncbi:DUF1643 domain-containing protein [Streptomyces sp. NPDC002758]